MVPPCDLLLYRRHASHFLHTMNVNRYDLLTFPFFCLCLAGWSHHWLFRNFEQIEETSWNYKKALATKMFMDFKKITDFKKHTSSKRSSCMLKKLTKFWESSCIWRKSPPISQKKYSSVRSRIQKWIGRTVNVQQGNKETQLFIIWYMNYRPNKYGVIMCNNLETNGVIFLCLL